MSFESELLARLRPDYSRFPAAGFTCGEDGTWRARFSFMDGQFCAEVTVTEAGETRGLVRDADTGDEYTPLRAQNPAGAFAARVREEYAAALLALARACYTACDFAGDQANRIAARIAAEFGTAAEFPWPGSGHAVFRDRATRRWFALIMADIPRAKLISGAEGRAEVLNVKADPAAVPALQQERSVYRCYHMNKRHWVSVILDGTLDDEHVMRLVRGSRALISRDTSVRPDPAPAAWIVPANYRRWDVERGFAENPVHLWTQTARVRPGDTVFLYIGTPVCAVWGRCTALETDIRGPNDGPRRLMKIKLRRVYGRELIPRELLIQHGVVSVRSARRVPPSLLHEIEKIEARLPDADKS